MMYKEDVMEVLANIKPLLNKMENNEDVYFIINEFLCDDEDVLEWYEGQILKAEYIDVENYGCYVDGCEYRIDLDHIILVEDI